MKSRTLASFEDVAVNAIRKSDGPFEFARVFIDGFQLHVLFFSFKAYVDHPLTHEVVKVSLPAFCNRGEAIDIVATHMNKLLAEKIMSKEEFLRIYEANLLGCFDKNPARYYYSRDKVPVIALNMYEALLLKTYSLDSGTALQLTFKSIGVKFTRKDVDAWVDANLR